MKKWQRLIVMFAIFVGAGSVFALAGPVSAINVFDQCDQNAGAAVCQAQDDDEVSGMVETVVNLLLFALGAVAVIMIVIGGIRYATSSGNATQAKEARDTILYAVVGLVVAILAYAIVNFVLAAF